MRVPSRRTTRDQQARFDAAVTAYRAYTALREANQAAEQAQLDDVRHALWEAWQAGVSVSDLADRMGVHRQRVYQLLDEAHARRIADAANVDGYDPWKLADAQEATQKAREELAALLEAS